MQTARKARVPASVIAKLETLRDRSTFEKARFGGIWQHQITKNGVTKTEDEFVKEQTRLYRETWILPQIDALLAWAKGEIEPDQIF